MKRFWVSFVLLLLTSCNPISNPLNAIEQYSFTPAQAFTRLGEDRSANNFDLLGVERAPDGKVVGIFTYRPMLAGQTGEYTFGYAVAERVNLLQWTVTNQFHSHQIIPKKSVPVDYTVLQEDYTAVFGPVFSEEVTAVEARFSDGEIVQDQSPGGYYLIFSDRGADVCEIRVFGKEGQVLYESILSRRGSESDACDPKK